MTTSKLNILRASGLIIATFALSSPAHADTVELMNGDLLTGTLTSMSEDSATVKSPISSGALEIKSSAIKQITFPNKKTQAPTHTEVLTLNNGDILPCRVLSMNEETLKISTWYAGNFNVDKENIRSLRFGISKERTIYTGGDDTSKWDNTQGSWTHNSGTYTSKGSGVLSRELDMPENIRLRFDFAWRETPNFAFRFCAESDSATRKQDTYELTFNSAGLQIRRYEGTQQYAPIANVGLKPHEVESKEISIDLRLNRAEGSITLYLNGQNAGTWHDLFEATKGKNIIFHNRSNKRSSCIISNILVSDWNDGSPSRHFKKISQTEDDTLLDSEGNKITGKIANILSNAEKKRTIEFNDNRSAKPLMVPDRRVSVLYFAKPEYAVELPHSVFTANLHGYGTLQLEQPKLENNKIIIDHPILGQCTLDPKIITSITQSREPAKK